ncbi:unnamed protein product [Cylindrotheca closterium]|uniref:Uncharacterized protein n=1 Tax=Cylindrotheca closterium TaxID=2856 RepID=A0AAD2CQX5_9STRA|nr:unnamed protein product [Cylindrotheca closterium]
MNITLTDEGDLDAKWTYDTGANVSSQFSSDWGGVLITPGDSSDDEEDDWVGVCVSGEDEEEFVLQSVPRVDQREPEPPVKKISKLQLEFVSPKLPEIAEDKEIANSPVTASTCRDSISSHDSGTSPPPAPKSPSAQNVMSPMERARLALSKRELTKSARSQQKASLKLSLDMMAFTGSTLDM